MQDLLEKNNAKSAKTPVMPTRSYLHEGQHANVQSILHANRIQAKLKMGQQNDKYEQEADRVAQQMMQKKSGVTELISGESFVQRQDHADVGTTEDISPDPPAAGSASGSARADRSDNIEETLAWAIA